MKKLFLLVMMAAFVFATGAPAQTVLLSETVADGVLENNWMGGYSGNTLEPYAYDGNPGGDGWVGLLGNGLSGGNVGQTYAGETSWADYYYEAMVYVPVSQGFYFGIEFRVDPGPNDDYDPVGNTSGYQFLTDFNRPPGDQKLRFRIRTGDGFPDSLKYWFEDEIPGGIPTEDGWHKMAVQAVGDQFWFYWNDQELPGCPYTDDFFSSGAIGAYVFDFMSPNQQLFIDDILVTEAGTAIEDTPDNVAGANSFRLLQNYPNPMQGTTTIRFQLPQPEDVVLDVFNVSGQKVKTLTNRTFSAGEHQVHWDGTSGNGEAVASGIYYYQLKAGAFQDTHKLIRIER